jgi:hypothetical protein
MKAANEKSLSEFENPSFPSRPSEEGFFSARRRCRPAEPAAAMRRIDLRRRTEAFDRMSGNAA